MVRQIRPAARSCAMSRSHEHLADAALTEEIIAAFYEVYNYLRPGRLEAVYCRALAIELRSMRLAVVEEAPITVLYKGTPVGHYRADLIVEGRIVLEVKSTPHLHPRAREQLLNYLRATSAPRGLVLGFGVRPQVVRVENPFADVNARTITADQDGSDCDPL